MSNADHEFGSVSTDLKLRLIDEYLGTFTKVLRRDFKHLWYIDAFAGTGQRTVKLLAREADMLHEAEEERLEQRRGSAKIAIEAKPEFDRLVFIDLKRKHYRALLDLKLEHPTRRIDVLRQDANAAIMEVIANHSFTSTRAVMFLDPYGMHVSWETLKAIQRTEAIDVWYFVSLEGLFRQASLDRSKITPKKRAAVTRMLGTADWETDWYAKLAPPDLFSRIDPAQERIADSQAIERYVGDRLATIFPKVLPPLRLKNRGGVGAFSLFFAVSNPKPEAFGLAARIAGHILNSGRSSHNRPR